MAAADGHSNGSLNTDGKARAAPQNRRALLIGSIASVVLLCVVLVLQADRSLILRLPAQWLAVAALPVLIGLMIGGYIGKFSFAGVEVEAPQLKQGVVYAPPGTGSGRAKTASRPGWTGEREAEYARTQGLALVHIYKPSTQSGQNYEISIYITRHIRGPEKNQTTAFDNIERAEFFFGPSWGDRIFTAQNNGGIVGVNTSAWGTFLATCQVIFRDGSDPVVLNRYIDFEMATP